MSYTLWEYLPSFINAATAIAAVLAFWWRFSRSQAIRDQVTVQLVERAQKTEKTVERLVAVVGELSTLLKEREKDQLRFEGQIEGTRKSLDDTKLELSKAIGSLDAMWITLQTLFPDKVPKRASDRG